jgi:hypothetical protein
MTLDRDLHLRWVANFFESKLKEHLHYLEEVTRICEQSASLASAKQSLPELLPSLLVYRFSAYTNTVMTLKDAGTQFLSSAIEKGDIETLRHGDFFLKARNAATHDGNPIISAWADGKFYVPEDIVRPGQGKNAIVTIPRPTADIYHVCLQFSSDFVSLISTKLRLGTTVPDLDGPVYAARQVSEILASSFIPEDIRAMVQRDLPSILECIANAKRDPLSHSLEQIAKIQAFCLSKLDPGAA